MGGGGEATGQQAHGAGRGENLGGRDRPLVDNETLRTIHRRKSIRSFDRTRPIPEPVLETILQAGIRASSSGQSYAIVKVTDSATKAELASMALKSRRGRFVQTWVKQAPVVLVFCADLHRSNRYMQLMMGSGLPHGHLSLLLATVEMSICLQNVITAATSLGIGTVICGNVLLEARRAKRLLGLPRGVIPVVQLPMGYPKRVPRYTTVRLPLAAVVHEERYREAPEEELRGWYHEHEKAFLDLIHGDIGAVERMGWSHLSEIRKRMKGKEDPDNWAQLFSDVIYSEEDLRDASREAWAAIKEDGFVDE